MPLSAFDSVSTPYSGYDAVYLVLAFSAVGMWLVFKRYEDIRNRALDFEWPAPEAAHPAWQSITIRNPSLASHLEDAGLLPQIVFPEHKYITCYDPSNGLHLGTLRADTAFEIGEKLGKATRAQKLWRKSDWDQRRKVMKSLLKWLVDNREACARVTCRDTGKTMVDSALGEIMTTCSKLEWLIKHGERALRPSKRSTPFVLLHKSSTVYNEPLGVVAAVVSWNYPLHNAWSPIIAALFAGNGIVLKCSEQVVWSSSWFVGAIQQCLRTCGWDDDLVQLVACWPEEAPALTQSPWIKHITFIGSEEIGKKAAAVHLTPVTLELGGKDPAIILPNTDIEKWAPTWLRGVFQNAGQNCIGIERFIVHESQYEHLVRILTARAQKLRLGHFGYIAPVDCGSMISTARFDELEHMIRNAEAEGAEICHGGTRWKHVYLDEGAYFSATVIAGVEPHMEIAKKELFGPIALVMRYSTIQEAIEIANSTRYGLGASVFGPDQRLAVKVARRLECGMVAVNDFAVFYVSPLPFGGVKASGYGRFSGPEGLLSLTYPKAVTVDRWPWLINTSIPAVLDYPIASLVQSWDFVSGLVAFLYANGWQERIHGLVRLVRASS
ncbi:meiotic sister-chromatid recombination aldehyde dehydrogenase [Hysterangium stoloniferum]|nr:meiotic sister-chromatid recombination aldehyde dehydrogenase [Hysterangium stoloniferum]